MAGEIASAFVRIKPNMTGFKAETEQGVKGAFSGLGRVASAAFGPIAAGAKVGTLAVGALGAATAVTGFKFDQMKSQAQIAFTTMLGSGQKAKTFLDDLQTFAARTPFEFTGLVQSSQKLLAMGFAAEQVIPTMTAIGDAVAGLGGNEETLNRVTVALGQIQAKGKASAEEMLQLTESGIPAWQMLADKIGKSVPEAMKLVSKGAIDSKTTVDAMTTGMEKRFGGMMDKQSHTFAGLWSTVKDTYSQISGTVMKPFFDLATGGLQRIVDIISKPSFTEGVKRFGASIQGALDTFMNAKGFSGKLEVVWSGVESATKSLTEKLGEVMSKVNWGTIWAKAGGIADGLATRMRDMDWSRVGRAIGDAISASIGRTAEGAKKLAEGLSNMVKAINWDTMGRAMGPGLATAVATAFATLLDPVFWIRHWDLALSIGLAVFGGAVGKIAGKILAPFARVFEGAILSLAGLIERLSPRLASAVLDGILALPGLLRSLWKKIEDEVGAVFGRLGKIARFAVRVLGIQAVIDTLVGWASKVRDILSGVATWLAKKAIEMGLALVEPFSHLPRWLGGGWAQDMKKSLQGALDKLDKPAGDTGTTLGKNLGGKMLNAFTPYATALQGSVSDLFTNITAGTPGIGTTPLAGGAVADYIKKRAKQMGLDAKAVIAVAMQEGLSGAIGDGGHAFGPFQLNNAGGVITGMFKGMTKEQIQQWAMSAEGIDFALARIKKVAGGLQGMAAINAIVAKFERPANIPKEIANAMTAYFGKVQAAVTAVTTGDTDTTTTIGVVDTKIKEVAKSVHMSLQNSYNALVARAQELGKDPAISRTLTNIRKSLATVHTSEDAAQVRAQMTTLGQTISSHLSSIKQSIALNKPFDALKQQIENLGPDTTPAIAKLVKTIQQEIPKVITPAQLALVKANMDRLKAIIKTQMDAIKDRATQMRSTFDGMWSRISTGADAAFDRATQKALAAMQVMVKVGSSSFLFGGGIAQTPAEKALADLTNAHDAAQDAARMSADQAELQAALIEGNAERIAAAHAAIADDEYNARVKALQAQAQIERDAATTQLSDAQTAYQTQRDLLKEQMDQRVALIEEGMLNGSIAFKDGMAQITAVLNDPQFGLDMKTGGIIIAGKLYEGLSAALNPTFELLNSLIELMKKAGMITGGTTIKPPKIPTLPASSSAGFTSDTVNSARVAAALAEQQKTQALILAELQAQTDLAKEGGGTNINVNLPGSRLGLAVAR